MSRKNRKQSRYPKNNLKDWIPRRINWRTGFWNSWRA